MGGDFIFYFPWSVPTALPIDRLAIEVVGPLASAKSRLGIYRADGDWQPTDLVVDGGEVDCSTVGLKEATVSTTLEMGLYVGAILCNAAPSLRWWQTGGPVPHGFGVYQGAGNFVLWFWRRSGVAYGPLPAVGPKWNAALSTSVPFPTALMVRARPSGGMLRAGNDGPGFPIGHPDGSAVPKDM